MNEIYYKAVRPDGTDFYTGTVDYAGICGTDQTLPVLPTVPGDGWDEDCGGPVCCTDEVYHASTSKADTLIGGDWPCRLFEVEGEAVAEEGTKRGFYTLKVLRELPAHEALGPNGEAVVALIEKAKTLTAEQVNKPYVPRDVARDAARDVAVYTARVAARDAARCAAMDAVWRAARAATGCAVRGATEDAAWRAVRTAAWRAARGAARDAAQALTVKDLIPVSMFDELYGPWASVMEESS